ADISLFDEAIIKAIPNWITRSKIGQYPRLYLRLCYNKKDFNIGDLRKYIKLEKTENLRGIQDVSLDLSQLKAVLEENVGEIEYILYYIDENIKASFKPFLESSKLKDKLKAYKPPS
ncbi:MAG: type I-B CRISPR-associated protein Cas7/Csh2, partial [Promethearchaeota archaeon]